MAADAAWGRAQYEAWMSGNENDLRNYLDPNVVWHAVGATPDSYNGIDSVLNYIGRAFRMARIGGEFDIKPSNVVSGDLHGEVDVVDNVIAHGNYLIGLHTAISTRGVESLADRTLLVGRVGENGLVTEVWQFFEDVGATQDFYLGG